VKLLNGSVRNIMKLFILLVSENFAYGKNSLSVFTCCYSLNTTIVMLWNYQNSPRWLIKKKIILFFNDAGSFHMSLVSCLA